MNIRTTLHTLTLAALGTLHQGCGARTGLEVVQPDIEARPHSSSSSTQCVVNQGPHCSARIRSVTSLDLSSGDPSRLQRVLLARYPILASMPLTDGYVRHYAKDNTSMDRPVLSDVRSAAEFGSYLFLGISNGLLIYRTRSNGQLEYADVRGSDFVNSMRDWRERFSAPGETPDIGLVGYVSLRPTAKEAPLHLNYLAIEGNCTPWTDVTAMAVQSGILYVVNAHEQTAHALFGLPGYRGASGANFHRPGDHTDLCRQ